MAAAHRQDGGASHAQAGAGGLAEVASQGQVQVAAQAALAQSQAGAVVQVQVAGTGHHQGTQVIAGVVQRGVGPTQSDGGGAADHQGAGVGQCRSGRDRQNARAGGAEREGRAGSQTQGVSHGGGGDGQAVGIAHGGAAGTQADGAGEVIACAVERQALSAGAQVAGACDPHRAGVADGPACAQAEVASHRHGIGGSGGQDHRCAAGEREVGCGGGVTEGDGRAAQAGRASAAQAGVEGDGARTGDDRGGPTHRGGAAVGDGSGCRQAEIAAQAHAGQVDVVDVVDRDVLRTQDAQAIQVVVAAQADVARRLKRGGAGHHQ